MADALRLGNVGVALDHQLPDRDRAFDGGDDRGKLQQQPVAHRLHNTPAKPGYDWSRHLSRCSRTASAVPASSSPIRRE